MTLNVLWYHEIEHYMLLRYILNPDPSAESSPGPYILFFNIWNQFKAMKRFFTPFLFSSSLRLCRAQKKGSTVKNDY